LPRRFPGTEPPDGADRGAEPREGDGDDARGAEPRDIPCRPDDADGAPDRDGAERTDGVLLRLGVYTRTLLPPLPLLRTSFDPGTTIGFPVELVEPWYGTARPFFTAGNSRVRRSMSLLVVVRTGLDDFDPTFGTVRSLPRGDVSPRVIPTLEREVPALRRCS
jgi:hypothetical protein